MLIAIGKRYNQAVDKDFCTADLDYVTVSNREEWFKQHSPHKYPIFVAENKNIISGWCSLSPHRSGRKALESIALFAHPTRLLKSFLEQN